MGHSTVSGKELRIIDMAQAKGAQFDPRNINTRKNLCCSAKQKAKKYHPFRHQCSKEAYSKPTLNAAEKREDPEMGPER